MNREIGRTGLVMRGAHARLERMYADLLRACEVGEVAKVRSRWDAFERAVRAHFDDEERHVLPAFREWNAAESDQLVAEHASLRKQLDAMRVPVHHQGLPLDQARLLIGALRAHVEREERMLYAWLDVPSEL